MTREIKLIIPFKDRTLENYEGLLTNVSNQISFDYTWKNYFDNLPYCYVSGNEDFPKILRTQFSIIPKELYLKRIKQYEQGIPIKPHLMSFDIISTSATQTNCEGMIKPVLEDHLVFDDNGKGLESAFEWRKVSKRYDEIVSFIECLIKELVEQEHPFTDLKKNIEPLYEYFQKK